MVIVPQLVAEMNGKVLAPTWRRAGRPISRQNMLTVVSPLAGKGRSKMGRGKPKTDMTPPARPRHRIPRCTTQNAPRGKREILAVAVAVIFSSCLFHECPLIC